MEENLDSLQKVYDWVDNHKGTYPPLTIDSGFYFFIKMGLGAIENNRPLSVDDTDFLLREFVNVETGLPDEEFFELIKKRFGDDNEKIRVWSEQLIDDLQTQIRKEYQEYNESLTKSDGLNRVPALYLHQCFTDFVRPNTDPLVYSKERNCWLQGLLQNWGRKYEAENQAAYMREQSKKPIVIGSTSRGSGCLSVIWIFALMFPIAILSLS